MITVGVEDIQRDPLTYLNRAGGGEIVRIVRADKSVLALKLVEPVEQSLRPFGLCAGEFTVQDDFDAPLPDDVLAEFEAA